MSAPLYSRFCRYADREASKFPKGSVMRNTVPLWKRPQTRVYALSDNAAYEAGWWSGDEPGELLRAMSLHYLPLPLVWIELPWRALIRGSARLPLGTGGDPMGITLGGQVDYLSPESTPTRVGFMIAQTSRERTSNVLRIFDKTMPEGTIVGLMYYHYPDGRSFVGPSFYGWHPSENVYAPIEVVSPSAISQARLRGEKPLTGTNLFLHDVALSPSYNEKNAAHPRLLKELQSRIMLTAIGAEHYPGIYNEIAGTARLAMAALTACLAAKPRTYVPDPNLPPKERKAREKQAQRVVEVDLFLRNYKRPGQSLRASVGKMEGIKKGLHTVGSHYAYRQRADGSDPTLCPAALSQKHDWEKLEGTKSEVCLLCGQKRWLKDAHQRGDAAYGIVPPKVYNVRAGAPSRVD